MSSNKLFRVDYGGVTTWFNIDFVMRVRQIKHRSELADPTRYEIQLAHGNETPVIAGEDIPRFLAWLKIHEFEAAPAPVKQPETKKVA